MDNLIIFGSGSQGRYVIENVRRSKDYNILGVVDLEENENVGKKIANLPILCTVKDFFRRFKPSDARVVVAYGDNRRKQELAERLRSSAYRFAAIISKEAYISQGAAIGEGSIINPMAVVMPDAKIGRDVILHSHVVVEHDCKIGDYANLAPSVSLAGRVEIGTGAYVYTGVSVLPGIRIGEWSVVGAGAVVTDDVPDRVTVAGVPAKILNSLCRKKL